MRLMRRIRAVEIAGRFVRVRTEKCVNVLS